MTDRKTAELPTIAQRNAFVRFISLSLTHSTFLFGRSEMLSSLVTGANASLLATHTAQRFVVTLTGGWSVHNTHPLYDSYVQECLASLLTPMVNYPRSDGCTCRYLVALQATQNNSCICKWSAHNKHFLNFKPYLVPAHKLKTII